MAHKKKSWGAVLLAAAIGITPMVWNELRPNSAGAGHSSAEDPFETAQPTEGNGQAASVDTGPAGDFGSTGGGGVVPSSTMGLLQTLPVKGRGPKTGYSRAQFGKAWDDNVRVPGGHNGCDTRNDILRRDLTNIVYKPRTRNCVVASGTLNDPYTGAVISFVRGPKSAAVQIDHIVALSNAWQMGAAQWDPTTRRDLANDPLNLLSVSGTANQQKRDSNAASWLPRNKAFRCTYVTRQIQVKAKYRIAVTAPEKDAMIRVLSKNCRAH